MRTRHFLATFFAIALSACGGGSAPIDNGMTESSMVQSPSSPAVTVPPPVAQPPLTPPATSTAAPPTQVPNSPSTALPVTAPAPVAAELQVMYRVTFSTPWSATTFPTQYPATRHFSGLVGATHDAAVEFWAPGMVASNGIERMAEQGSKSTLLNEVGAAPTGRVGTMLSGDGIGITGSEVTLYFFASQQHPLVTLVSMVAPSPDWFVGVRSLPLFENGAWHERVVVALPVWDAGTDDGVSYASADIEPAPHGVIRLLTSTQGNTDFHNGVHRVNGAALASFTFERVR